MPSKVLIMEAVRWAAVGFTSILVLISIAIMIVERTITAEAWAMLLLAPIPAGFALTTGKGVNNASSEIVEWIEDSEPDSEKSVGDPSESGFDVPVL
jgi:hypothetical protein